MIRQKYPAGWLVNKELPNLYIRIDNLQSMHALLVAFIKQVAGGSSPCFQLLTWFLLYNLVEREKWASPQTKWTFWSSDICLRMVSITHMQITDQSILIAPLTPLVLTITGFSHSAFTFAHESLVVKSSTAQTEIPPGALITFLQKGLEYIAIEEHINEVRSVSQRILLLLTSLTNELSAWHLGWLDPRIRQQLFIAEPSDLRGHCRQRRPPISPHRSSDWCFRCWCCCWEQCVQRSRVDGCDQWRHFCCDRRSWRQQRHGCVQYRRFYSPACVSLDLLVYSLPFVVDTEVWGSMYVSFYHLTYLTNTAYFPARRRPERGTCSWTDIREKSLCVSGTLSSSN